MDSRTADCITPELSRNRRDKSTLVKVPITIWAEGKMGGVCQPSSTQIPLKVDSAYQVMVELCNCRAAAGLARRARTSETNQEAPVSVWSKENISILISQG